MKNQNRIQVHLTDKMVLIAIGFAAAYWLIETFLYIIFSYQLDFFQRLFGPDLSGLCTRLIVLCLFVLFGAHAQFTINQRKETEDELRECRKRLEELGEKHPVE